MRQRHDSQSYVQLHRAYLTRLAQAHEELFNLSEDRRRLLVALNPWVVHVWGGHGIEKRLILPSPMAVQSEEAFDDLKVIISSLRGA